VPLYEYRCNHCKHRFEKIQKFSDDPVRICPQCGEEAVEQMLSAPTVQFKGSGWYVTDYGKGNGRTNTHVSSSHEDSASSAPPAPPVSKPAAPVAESK
jgi:putative FmdB family regulatory protein